jgi:hypothetical protein
MTLLIEKADDTGTHSETLEIVVPGGGVGEGLEPLGPETVGLGRPGLELVEGPGSFTRGGGARILLGGASGLPLARDVDVGQGAARGEEGVTNLVEGHALPSETTWPVGSKVGLYEFPSLVDDPESTGLAESGVDAVARMTGEKLRGADDAAKRSLSQAIVRTEEGGLFGGIAQGGVRDGLPPSCGIVLGVVGELAFTHDPREPTAETESYTRLHPRGKTSHGRDGASLERRNGPSLTSKVATASCMELMRENFTFSVREVARQ